VAMGQIPHFTERISSLIYKIVDLIVFVTDAAKLNGSAKPAH